MGDVDVSGDPWRGRRDWRWMAMWPLTSLLGGLCAFVLVWVAVAYGTFGPEGQGLPLPMARIVGRSVAFFVVHAVFGALLGLLVALVLTFLVGDAGGQRAERATRVVAGGTYAIVGILVMVLLGAGGGTLLIVVATSGAVGVVAGWWHRRLASRPRVEDFYAH